MDCFGRLAGGIAHDFNNILTAIMGYTDLLQSRLQDGRPAARDGQRILGAENRAAKLTGSLLSFGRKQVLTPRPLELGELVTGRSAADLADHRRGCLARDHEPRRSRSPFSPTPGSSIRSWSIWRPTRATRCRGAARSGSPPSIVRRRARGGAGRGLAAGGLRPADLSDTGVGMDEQTLEQVFEPFFTTKEPGRGTGLGLAIVYGIVKQHGGGIDVASQPGAGTTFRIYLPLQAQDAAAAPGAGGNEQTRRRGARRDDPDRRGRRDGARDGGADPDRLGLPGSGRRRRRGGRSGSTGDSAGNVDLLPLDVIMPRKSGKEAYDEIRSRWGDVKVLFRSRSAPDLVYRDGLLDKSLPFLQKPVARKTLLDKVREVLEAARPRPA